MMLRDEGWPMNDIIQDGSPVTFSDLPMRTIEVNGIDFSYYEGGTRGAQPIVLLHSGEFGANAATSWSNIVPQLSGDYWIIAPDWLGYGCSAKIFDFNNNTLRRLMHLRDGLNSLGVKDAHFVGTSLGGTMLLQVLTRRVVDLPIRSAALLSSGGPMPASRARQILTDYDGSREGMRSIIATMFFDAQWAQDESYLDYRWRLSQVPGHWEAVAAARFQRPDAKPKSEFGRPDSFEYENIDVPVLAVGGSSDKLKPQGYLDTFVPRIKDGHGVLLDECGHCPNVEHPEKVAQELKNFHLEAC